MSPKSNSVKSKSSLKGFMKRTDSEVVGSEGSVHKLKTRPKLEVQDISISSRQDKSFGKKLAVDEPIKKK